MDRIGRYRIEGELGRGAMGVVYRATDPAIGRAVAIKTIRLADLADVDERAKLRDRLMREAHSAGILSHPNIVTIYDTAEEDGLAYIAMEYVNGMTLDRAATESPLSGAQVLDVVSQTAAALDYAHKRGIVHRDIKPSNVMLAENGSAKIMDFGVAKIQSHQMTQSGAMIGTPNYMSPEQIQGKPVDGRSDQYALAVIAYELLTGEKPFTADSIATLAYKIVSDEPTPVHNLNPTLDWPVDTVLRRGLAKDPAARYPTCSDFAFALENACRACKKWKPLPPGAALNEATVIGQPAPLAPEPATATPVAPPPPIASREPVPVPVPLRWMRVLALVVLGASIAGALLVGALHWLADRNKTEVAAAPEAEPAVKVPKPSAVPKGPELALPGDRGTNPEQPQAESAKPDPEPEPDAAAPAKPPAPRAVPTKLVTNPPGAQLVVDGREDLACTSPCSLELPPGRHTVAATLDGYRRTLRILETPRDNDVFLNLDRNSGAVVVRSEPRGATIYVNGQQRAERTPAMLNLPTGRYTLEVVGADGQRERQEINVRDGAITNVSVSFDR